MEDVTPALKSKKSKKKRSRGRGANKVLLSDFDGIQGAEALLTLGKSVYRKAACFIHMFPARDTAPYVALKALVDASSAEDEKRAALIAIGASDGLRKKALKYVSHCVHFLLTHSLIDFVQANYGTNNIRRTFGDAARNQVNSEFRFTSRSPGEIVRNSTMVSNY